MSQPNGPTRLARARRSDLVIQELPDEVLVYDLKSSKAHCLNQTAGFVWNHCDGQTTAAEIAELMGIEWHTTVSEDAVWFALAKLSKAGLLEEPLDLPQTKTGMSRRSAVRRLALGSLLVPAVISLVAPTASAGASIPPPCAVCNKRVTGIDNCPNVCAGLQGTCYSNSGCGVGQECTCVTCVQCFGGALGGTRCDGNTVSWVVPGGLGCPQ